MKHMLPWVNKWRRDKRGKDGQSLWSWSSICANEKQRVLPFIHFARSCMIPTTDGRRCWHEVCGLFAIYISTVVKTGEHTDMTSEVTSCVWPYGPLFEHKGSKQKCYWQNLVDLPLLWTVHRSGMSINGHWWVSCHAKEILVTKKAMA